MNQNQFKAFAAKVLEKYTVKVTTDIGKDIGEHNEAQGLADAIFGVDENVYLNCDCKDSGNFIGLIAVKKNDDDTIRFGLFSQSLDFLRPSCSE